ncbi:MAG: MarR family transcriptional regulator [Candidatus Izemoplasmatales bacterium]
MTGCMKYISVTARCAIQFHGDRLADLGLNGYQSSYILHLCRQPGISQERLAQRLHVNRSNVTRQLVLLERLGYVERRKSADDRRVIEVHPTAKAIEALPRVRAVLREYSDYLCAEFTPAETETLNALLERVAARAEARDAKRKEDAR